MSVLENFGIDTFDKQMMKKRLPYPIYLKWKNAVRKEDVLDKQTADIIAHEMKMWAVEKGATHYCHWFQPLNGLTAKKHDSFIDRSSDNLPIVRFSGKELIQGEPDASSFPSGGMRSTFEARGYTYWDCSSNSFIIDNVMYIPSIFVSFNGETLDKKGPLLKSVDVISEYGTEVVNLFAKEHAYRLRTKVGVEQEFFLVDEKSYNERIDLKYTGRTLFGNLPPKGQELDDHYFGAIPERVSKFYQEVNEILWRLGIYAKTEHNEVAPNQFEIAIMFENSSIAVDDNHLVTEVLKKTARKHHMVCLLHEKPFQGVNGSGKHNNWSVATNYGLNLLNPGPNPKENILFLLFLSATIQAVHESSTLLRIASSQTSNDYRLGGAEAPPAIISIDLGEDIDGLVREIIEGKVEVARDLKEFTIHNLSYVPRDMTDRNRTSPFAFTGNKFEFRMLGSMKTPADVNIVLNTAVGKVLKEFYFALKSSKEPLKDAYALVKETLQNHQSVIFHGDNYEKEWEMEAQKRGLKNYPHVYDALVNMKTEENYAIYDGVLTRQEVDALYEVGLEDVINTHRIEAKTLIQLVNKYMISFAMDEINDLTVGYHNTESQFLKDRKEYILMHMEQMMKMTNVLKEKIQSCTGNDVEKKAAFYQSEVFPMLGSIREHIDALEQCISKKYFKLPTYEELLSSIN